MHVCQKESGCEPSSCTGCKDCHRKRDEKCKHEANKKVILEPAIQHVGDSTCYLGQKKPGAQPWPLAWSGFNPTNIFPQYKCLGNILGYPDIYDVNRPVVPEKPGDIPFMKVPDIARNPMEYESDPFGGLNPFVVGYRPLLPGESLVLIANRVRVPIAPPIICNDEVDHMSPEYSPLQTTGWDATKVRVKDPSYPGGCMEVPVGYKNVWSDMIPFSADAWNRELTTEEMNNYGTGGPHDPLTTKAGLIYRAPSGVPAPLIKIFKAAATDKQKAVHIFVLNADKDSVHSIDFHAVPMDRVTMTMSVTGLGTSWTKNTMEFPYEGVYGYHCVGNMSPP